MARGTQRGKVAAIGWQQVSYAEIVQGMTTATYADAAAFEADWTKHEGTDTIPPTISVSDITTGGVLLLWGGGSEGGDAYYEKTISGLTPGTTYDALITFKKGGSGDMTAMRVIELDGAPMGSGVPSGAMVTRRHRFVADVSGETVVRVGEWGQSIALNGSITIYAIEFREVDGTAVAKTLLFRLDGALTWPAPKEGSRNRRSEDGLGALYELPGVDHFLRGTARRIPQTAPVGGVMDDGATITAWDDDGGWQDFLPAARDKQLLTFYPDASDLLTSVPCYLVEPLQGRPDLDGPGYYQLPLKLVSSSPFDGY